MILLTLTLLLFYFRLTYFFEKILQSTSSKISQGQPWVFSFNFYIFVWYNHRKKVLKNFRKFISQERPIIVLIWCAYCLWCNSLFQLQCHLTFKFIIKIVHVYVITDFCGNLINVRQKKFLIKNACKKLGNWPMLNTGRL